MKVVTIYIMEEILEIEISAGVSKADGEHTENLKLLNNVNC